MCSRPGRHCSGEPLRPDVLVSTFGVMGDGTPGPGLAILMVLMALMVSVEYRYKTIGTPFMVTPRRGVVLLAKMAIAVGVALVVGLLAIVCSAAAFCALGGTAGRAFHPLSEETFRVYATVPLSRRSRPRSRWRSPLDAQQRRGGHARRGLAEHR